MREPLVAVGDGALGFWNAVREVWPETDDQRDWCHKLANVLDKLPKRLQGKAKEMLRDAMYAPTREDAEAAMDGFWTMTFDFVAEGGMTSLEITSTGPLPPSGFQLGSPPTCPSQNRPPRDRPAIAGDPAREQRPARCRPGHRSSWPPRAGHALVTFPYSAR